MLLRWGRATPVARLHILFWDRAHLARSRRISACAYAGSFGSAQAERAVHDAPLEWRAPDSKKTDKALERSGVQASSHGLALRLTAPFPRFGAASKGRSAGAVYRFAPRPWRGDREPVRQHHLKPEVHCHGHLKPDWRSDGAACCRRSCCCSSSAARLCSSAARLCSSALARLCRLPTLRDGGRTFAKERVPSPPP